MTVSAVVLRDPPTGSPRNKPEAMFAPPCAMKSRDMLRRDPSGLGTLWLTPAPCTRMTTATANAPVSTSNETLESAGRCGVGIPVGISPTSRTVATLLNAASTTTTDGTMIATSRPKFPSGVRGRTVARSSVTPAMAIDGTSASLRCTSRSNVRVTRFAPAACS